MRLDAAGCGWVRVGAGGAAGCGWITVLDTTTEIGNFQSTFSVVWSPTGKHSRTSSIFALH